MVKKILNKIQKNKFILNNNLFIFSIFNICFILFCFYIIDQFSEVLINRDFYRYFLIDGESHINLIWETNKNFNFEKIHYSGLYNNNYYIFSALIYKLFLSFFDNSYSAFGFSAITLNLISIYIIFITSFLICFRFSRSKLLSIGISLLLWNQSLINFSLTIYPDILQLAFIFLSIYFMTLKKNFRWLLSLFFCGLAFGVKAQGLLIFVYLITIYIIHEFVKINLNNFKLVQCKDLILKTFFYCALFFLTFYFFNRINFLNLFDFYFSIAKSSNTNNEFNNAEIVYDFLKYLLRGENNFIILIFLISGGLFFSYYEKQNRLLLFLTCIFLFLFYFQLSNFNKLVQGPRYLFHFLPILVIIIAISFNNVANFFTRKKFKIFQSLIPVIILIYGTISFQETFSNTIVDFDYKTKIKNDPMIEGYNFFKKNIFSNKKDPLVCSGMYSMVPKNFSKKIRKAYQHLYFEKKIMNKECDFILLDSSTPGRYIWFKDDLKNLKIKEYKNLSDYTKLDGKDIIEKNQNLIIHLLKNPKSGYKVDFYNNKMIILSKK